MPELASGELEMVAIAHAVSQLSKVAVRQRQAGRWFVCFSVELPEPELLPTNDRAVGIDVGLTRFGVLGGGTEVANPATSAPPSTGCGLLDAS
jgi:transposase